MDKIGGAIAFATENANDFYGCKAVIAKDFADLTDKVLEANILLAISSSFSDEIETKLVEIGELSTYSGEYSVTREADYSRYFIDDIKIPGTTNTVHIECEGIVKVGYNIDDVNIKVDNDSFKIYIGLPEAAVNDNYVIWDTVKCVEANNFLNPIDFAQYQTLIDEIEADGLKQAEEKGIYKSAEDNVKKIIVNFLSGFDGFEIIFM